MRQRLPDSVAIDVYTVDLDVCYELVARWGIVPPLFPVAAPPTITWKDVRPA